MYKQVIFSTLAVVLLALTVQARPPYIECNTTLECGLGHCCVLGTARFSLPRCMPFGRVNDQCRPHNYTPVNATLTYPDGETVDLIHVYSLKCPCEPGLYCSDKTGTCKDLVDDILLNTI